MTKTVELPLWLFALILLFAAVTFASHFLFPSVRWFFRRRLERAVARLNERLDQPIQPFKLTRRFDMIQRIIYNPQVSQAIADHARAEGIPENVAFQQARRYAREIVPSFSASLYFGVAIRLARFLSNALYHVRLRQLDEPALRAIDRDATVVFVMNHRSNMDYVLVTYLAAERSALSYAVGEWAQVWPLSRLIRAMGAYFIRRRSRNDLYRAVLACYVRLATDAGVTQAMFPEGGLSLTGGLMPPKLGLLKYIAAGVDPDGRDVVFVPVALNLRPGAGGPHPDRGGQGNRTAFQRQDRRDRAPCAATTLAVGHRAISPLWRGGGDLWRASVAGRAAGRGRWRHDRPAGGNPDAADCRRGSRPAGALVAWLMLAHGAMTRAEIDARARAALATLPTSTAADSRPILTPLPRPGCGHSARRASSGWRRGAMSPIRRGATCCISTPTRSAISCLSKARAFCRCKGVSAFAGS